MKQNNTTFLFVDFNSFFASCQQQANPLLIGKPIGVIGNHHGNTVDRGNIIAAASYEAKAFGVKSGTPIHEARKLCPHIVLVPAQGHIYQDIHARFVEILKKYSDRVHVHSIDEASLEVSTSQHLHEGSRAIAMKIKEDIRSKLGKHITCSIGISFNQTLAKLGTELQKPDGLIEITRSNFQSVVWPLVPGMISGIGPKTVQKLNSMGIYTVGDIARADRHMLAQKLGLWGRNVYRIAHGEESFYYSWAKEYTYTPSKTYSFGGSATPKSISNTRTTSKNLYTRAEILARVLYLAEKVGTRARKHNVVGEHAALILRYEDFTTFSKHIVLGSPTHDPYTLYTTCKQILNTIHLQHGIRLVGVRLSKLSPNAMEPLFQKDRARLLLLEAQDKVNKKWGAHALERSVLKRKSEVKSKKLELMSSLRS